MFSRVAYAFRETAASFRRNITLTAAAILTAAVALLLSGVAFLMQRAFNNLLTQWDKGVEMIVYVKPGASNEQVTALRRQLDDTGVADNITYLDQSESFDKAKTILAGQDTLLSALSVEKMPSQLRIKPTNDGKDRLDDVKAQFANNPGVYSIALASGEIRFYRQLSGFVRGAMIVTSLALLAVALTLIWNTIRTAMFARRREIEVMKLVGATNWFIRIPFMLEGLLQGLIGALLSCGGLLLINTLWTSTLNDLGKSEGDVTSGTLGLLALRVESGYLTNVMLLMIVIGMLAGAIGAGVAASRFLDV
jgi:cell division transport system permease protein